MVDKLVLVVEDEFDLRAFVEMVLQQEGYRVATAANGLEALEQVDREKPELILLDMRMPIMDGWQFVKEMRNKHDHSIPIVVMTALHDAYAVAKQIDAKGYLRKPFEIDDLLRSVAKFAA
ncbi:MAG: response regulator [Chloroflexi bacterium]|nr:response regulator [Chloroflexota bacterium]